MVLANGLERGRMDKSVFRDDRGFTTLGMTVSLLLCLSLVLASAQVYRINSVSAAVQDAADASALAAQTEVAEFMIAAQVCDAVILSLTLASAVSTGVGVACLCTPLTASLSSGFVDAGKTFAKAKKSFSETAVSGLQSYQRALPFIAAVRAALIAQSNSGQSSSEYHAVAVSLPLEGDEIVIPNSSENDEAFFEKIEQDSDHVQTLSEAAEKAAQDALEAKQRGFEADCGGQSSTTYCMYGRALSLANMAGTENPWFSSVDTWSFSAALNRAKAYYQERLKREKAISGNTYDQAQSEVRRIFYQYACQEMEKGYVNESEDLFEAYFPMLPRNMQQMRQTDLYGKAAFPVTSSGEHLIMHGWNGCPNASGYDRLGSICDLETNGNDFQTCPACEFTPESLGNVASATSSTKTGFEYHYILVAQAADDYQKAREELDPLTSQAKESAQSLFDACKEHGKRALSDRIEVNPPGACGAIAIVFDSSSMNTSSWGLVGSKRSLGPRFAVAGASLLEDTSEDGGTVLTNIMSGMSDEAKRVLGPLDSAVSCWSGLLEAYGSGQQALSSTIEELLCGIPFASASGLGSWASNAFQETMEQLGLQPARLKALKPVIANTGSVASACDDDVARGYVQLQQDALENAAALDSVMTWSSRTLSLANKGISLVGDSVEVASFCPFGESGPCFTLCVPLPAGVQNRIDDVLRDAASGIQGLVRQVEGLSRWR